jgi:hypothetical protein
LTERRRHRAKAHARCSVKLNSIGGILTEQCRIYRLWCNGRLSTKDLAGGTASLDRIRSTLEMMPEATTSRPISSVTIVSVPSSHFFRHPRADIDGMPSLENGALMIEHDAKPRLALEPEPPQPEAQSPEEARLIAELEALPIEELARRAGVSLNPQPAPEPDNPNIVMSASLKRKRELAALEAERRAAVFSPRPLQPPRRTQRPPGPSWG